MRIIAGERKGMKLVAPKGETTKPTLGRVRESLFMVLHERIEDARVLDLFAGAGGLVLEALSRGAASGVTVDASHAAIVALQTNCDKLEYHGRCTLVEADVFRWLARAGRGTGPYDLIFIDPPYGENLGDRTMEKLAEDADAWLAPEGIIIAQVGKRDVLKPSYGSLASTFNRIYGETRIEFFGRNEQA